MTKLSTAEIELRAKDYASKTINKVDKNIEKLEKQSDKSSKKIDRNFSKLGDTIRLGLGVALGQIIAQVGQQFVAAAKDAVSKTIEWEQSWQVFNSQIGNADELLNKLRTSSKGLVSDLDLVNTANRAIGLGLEVDTLPALQETAIALGKIQGLEASQAFNDIVTGIARASPLILDNLGIILDAEVTYGRYAETIGKTAKELSKSEKALALQSQTIKNSRLITLRAALAQKTLSEELQSFGAEVDNLKISVGTFFADSLVTLRSNASKAAEAQDIYNESLSTTGKVVDGLLQTFTPFKLGYFEQVELIQEITENEEKFNESLLETQSILNVLNDEIQNLGTELDDYKSKLEETRKEFDKFLSLQTEESFENEEELLRLKREQLLIDEALAELGLTERKDLSAADIAEVNKVLDDANERYKTQIVFGKDRLDQIKEEKKALDRRNEIERTNIDLLKTEEREGIVEAKGEDYLGVANFEAYQNRFNKYINEDIPGLKDEISGVQDELTTLNETAEIVIKKFADSAENLRLSAVYAAKLSSIVQSLGGAEVNIDIDVDLPENQLTDIET